MPIAAQGAGMRHFDVVAMFASLWLLASMVIDVATPKELTVFMIGAAIAPATGITALLYWARVPTLDFAVSFATLWLVSGMVIELITPKPLSPLMALVTVAPMVIVGTVINFLCWRRSRQKTISISQVWQAPTERARPHQGQEPQTPRDGTGD
jgi:hypothetical protein